MTRRDFNNSMGMTWGDKGCNYDPARCNHPEDDGCEWCCMICNTDSHWCPVCGTVSNHKAEPCGTEDCKPPNWNRGVLLMEDSDGQ